MPQQFLWRKLCDCRHLLKQMLSPRLPEHRRRVRHQAKYPQCYFDFAQQPCSSIPMKSSKNCLRQFLRRKLQKITPSYSINCFRPRLPERSRRGRVPKKSSKNCLRQFLWRKLCDERHLLKQTLSPRLPERSRRGRVSTRRTVHY